MKNKQRNIKKKKTFYLCYMVCVTEIPIYVLKRNHVKSTSMVHQTIQGESAADVEEIEFFSDTGEES